MASSEIESDVALQRTLWAAFNYWNNQEVPPEEHVICYKWVVGVYKKRFHTSFHNSKLLQLEKLGLLKKADLSRGGSRRYYEIVDTSGIESLLHAWQLG